MTIIFSIHDACLILFKNEPWYNDDIILEQDRDEWYDDSLEAVDDPDDDLSSFT